MHTSTAGERLGRGAIGAIALTLLTSLVQPGPVANAVEPLVTGVSADLQASVLADGTQTCATVDGTANDTRSDWGTTIGTMTISQEGSFSRPVPEGSTPDTGTASAAAEMTASVDTTNGLLTRFDSTRTATASAHSVRGYDEPYDITDRDDSLCRISAKAGDGDVEVRFVVQESRVADLDVAGTDNLAVAILETLPEGETFWTTVAVAGGSEPDHRSVVLPSGNYKLSVSYSFVDSYAGYQQGSGADRSANNSVSLFLSPQTIENTSPPTITGTARVGVKLTASPGEWTPVGLAYAYQWRADGVSISGATSSGYTPTAAVKGKRISVRVTASKTGYASRSATSAPSGVVLAGIIKNTGLPYITGTKRVGYTLTAYAGSWSPSGLTYRYQWFKGTTAITGATARTYKLPAGVRGKQIRVRVTASRTGYTSLAKYSAYTTAIK